MRTSAFLVAKNFGFFEIYGRTDKRGRRGSSESGYFSDKPREGVNVVRTSL